MIENYSEARFWLDVAVLTGVIANTAYTWLANRSKVNKAAIEQVGHRVGGLERRIGELEADVRHLPGRGDVDDLHERITGVSNQMGEMRGELHGINRTLSLIHQSLLDERNSK